MVLVSTMEPTTGFLVCVITGRMGMDFSDYRYLVDLTQ